MSVLSLNDEIAVAEIAIIDDILTTETKHELIAAINALKEYAKNNPLIPEPMMVTSYIWRMHLLL